MRLGSVHSNWRGRRESPARHRARNRCSQTSGISGLRYGASGYGVNTTLGGFFFPHAHHQWPSFSSRLHPVLPAGQLPRHSIVQVFPSPGVMTIWQLFGSDRRDIAMIFSTASGVK